MFSARFLIRVILFAVCFPPLPAVGGEISGTVIGSRTRLPVKYVEVRVLSGAVAVGRDTTGGDGGFRFSDLPPTPHDLELFLWGSQVGAQHGVVPGAPGSDRLLLELVQMILVLNPDVKTISKRQESWLGAPASTSVLDRSQIGQVPLLTPVDPIRTTEGVDFASKGLIQHTFAVRGSRSVNSGALLVLTDGRYAGVPSLDINIPYLLAVTEEDIDRIEVVRGPSAALYGPNSDRGVLQIFTRSPFDSRGTSVALGAGERSVRQVRFRHAGVVGDRVGYKISAEYMEGDDWVSEDPQDVLPRDFHTERLLGEARLDWRPSEDLSLTLNTGVAKAGNTVDLTPVIGGVQVRNWTYPYLQLRAEKGRLLANLLYNASNSGDTYALRTGEKLVDKSRLAAFQLQHTYDVASRTQLLYGADGRWTDPRTEGTIHGRNEDDDTIWELGAYLHVTRHFNPQVSGVAALRADYHDRLDDVVLSPRFGVVYQPSASHAVRLTFNSAFSSPDANALFVDVPAGSLGDLPYGLRASSVPRGGFSFSRGCEGEYCMQVPWGVPGTPPSLPADATLTWDALVAILAQQGVNLSDVPRPDASEVGTVLARLIPDDEVYELVGVGDLATISGPARVIRHTIEAGYKGNLGGRVSLNADVYASRVTDNRGRRYAATPNVFFDQATLEAYLSQFSSVEDPAATAAMAARIPMGTVGPDQGGDGSDILLVTQLVGDYTYTFWGADVGFEAELSRIFVLGGSYSYFHRNVQDGVPLVGTVVLGVPDQKVSLGLRYHSGGNRFTAGVTARFLKGFEVEDGVYVGEVAGYGVVDVSGTFTIPGSPSLSLSVSAGNVFDNRHVEYVGGAELGRLTMFELGVSF